MKHSLFVRIAIATFLFVIILPSNSALSSLQQEQTIQSTGTITYQKNFADEIFFEYGAETGVLQDPWDLVGPNGSGDMSGAGAIIDTTYVRTGSKAIKIFQPVPPKSDAQRRVGLKLYGASHGLDEFYFSFWVYLPTGFESVVQDSSPQWGPTVGGVIIYWGNLNDPNSRWSKGLRFRHLFDYSNGDVITQINLNGFDLTGDNPTLGNYEVSGLAGRKVLSTGAWHHFQFYYRMGDMSTGIAKSWVDNDLVFDETTATDPAYFGEPEAGDLWGEGYSSHPTVLVESYCSQDTPAHEIWFDDIVISTEKVPESYGIAN